MAPKQIGPGILMALYSASTTTLGMGVRMGMRMGVQVMSAHVNPYLPTQTSEEEGFVFFFVIHSLYSGDTPYINTQMQVSSSYAN